ncbi:acyltransferase domain-containing protein [Actinomadura soli]|uniref:Acyltransferase domain-containing protein n=1 Tax=Actinomadura soli TaxID=2508997 RepID=A0A5C4JE58_9ACTN|nr:type I polyketide synthase [Actinomadura soli]TMR02600.1 acyltransferase domain-containing protein [Actinomadura soli]
MSDQAPARERTDQRASLAEAARTIERLQRKLRERSARPPAEPVAIIGLGCRFPGGADTPDRFWRLLADGVDAVREFPPERDDAGAVYHPDPDEPGKAYTVQGGFLDEVSTFEPAVFGISPREALGMDPQQRLALEVAWEALERAGQAPDRLAGTRTGVFMGLSTTDYVRMRQSEGDIRDVDAYQLIGEPSFAAGRISYTLGLEGPCKVIDTTCSSSLVAVHDACQALRLGECDMALAGGVNMILSAYGYVLMSKFKALSPDGRCKTFDASADGYGRGEGAGVLVLKRLSDAIENRDPVLAVVQGSAVNHDGRSSGLTVPNPAAQQDVIRAALAQARLDPAHLDYVEVHGTGTSLGDPIELRALEAVIGRHHADEAPLLVGSVKTNIGHLEPAAGVAGLCKLVLSLRHGWIPPHLHFTDPNPNVDWDRLHIRVAADGTPWPDAAGRPRAGAVSSFGVSGTNAHCIVRSHEAAETGDRTGDMAGPLLLSAHTPQGLAQLAGRFADHLRESPGDDLADVCYTTQVGRSRQRHGLVASAGTPDAMADALEAHARGGRHPSLGTAELQAHKHRKPAWLFTGQGAQYAGMAAGLSAEPAFAEALDECAEHFDPLLDRPLREVIWPRSTDGDAPDLDDTRYTQPALFAVEYALARLWRSWGVTPGALAGHSIGEITAACVAGVLTLPDAARLVAARSALMAVLPADGVMTALGLTEEEALEAIGARTGTVAVAAVNGPHSVVLSGLAEDVAAIEAELAARDVRAQRLSVSHAFHSPLLKPMLAEFRAIAAEIEHREPEIPLVSNVTGRFWEPGDGGPDYWVRHAAQTVRFHEGLRTLHDGGYRTFVELGPSPVLSALGARALDDPTCAWIPVLRRPKPNGPEDRTSVRAALGMAVLRGVSADWDKVHTGTPPRRVPLPATVWQGSPYWFEKRRNGAAATGQAPTEAGSAAALPAGLRRLRAAVPTYQADLSAPVWAEYTRSDGSGRYLSVGGLGIVVDAAVNDALDSLRLSVADVRIDSRVPMDDPDRILQITVSPGHADTAAVEIHSVSRSEEEAGAPWTRHARGVVRRPIPGSRRIPVSPDGFDPGSYGRAIAHDGASLPPALLDAISGAHRGGRGVLVALEPPDDREPAARWGQLLDASVAALSWAADGAVPDSFTGRARRLAEGVLHDPARVRHVTAAVTAHGTTGDGAKGDAAVVTGDIEFLAEDGARLGTLRGLEVVDTAQDATAGARWRSPGELLYEVGWERAAAPSPARVRDESVLLIADRGGTAAALAGRLRQEGAHCQIIDPGDDGIGPSLLDGWTGPAAPGRIVVLTGLDAPDPETCDGDAVTAFLRHGELTVIGLVQRLLERPAWAETKVSLVTRGAVAAEDRLTAPLAGTLWGLGRVIALEHPEHWGGAVDLDPSAPEDADLDALIQALLDPSSEDEHALRDRARYVPRLNRAAATAPMRGAPRVSPSGSYLITGAFGGIGQAVGEWLARHGAGRLVLLARTPLPPRAEWDGGLAPGLRERVAVVRRLEALGAEVEVVAADVADAGRMEAVVSALRTARRPLRGVVHAAGVSKPQFLRDVPVTAPDDYDAVWRPKVAGGWLLHRLTAGLDLDFFLGFSSIAATWGSQHLSSYASGNAFLDALAAYRRRRGEAALTVDWGPWDLPSALFDEEVLSFLTSTGLRTLAAPQCLRLLGALLAAGASHGVVCAADWSTFRPVMEARIDRPLLHALDVSEETGEATAPLLDDLAQAPPEKRTALLVAYVQDVLGDVLGIDPRGIAVEDDVIGYGLDSLMVMEVVKRCKRDLQVTVRPNAFFARTTLGEWAALLGEETGAETTEDEEADLTLPSQIARRVELDPDIRPSGPLGKGYQNPRRVLLTGATGFVGAYLLDELLSATDATVVCLTRCADETEGLARIRGNLEHYLPWRDDADERIEVLPGDLAAPLLGLEASAFGALAESVDAIYHCGAWVSFSYTYRRLEAANVDGLAEILRLACTGPLTPVSHVSTYGIWGIPEDGRSVIAEADPIATAGRLVTGYVQTKWAAERLVEIARERGIPVDVHRPGRVLGDSRTGACLTTHFTTRVIRGCVQLGMAPDLDLEIEMTPVDYVSAALVRISRAPHAFGTNFHLVNRRKMHFGELVRNIGENGWPVAVVPVEKWWQELQESFAERDNVLHPVMDVVEEFVVGGEEAIDYDTANAEEVLAGTGVECPPLDERLLRTYFSWMARTGYLPPAGG